MGKKSKAEELADLIEKNPNCLFEIDNDCWYMSKKTQDIQENDEDEDELQIASSTTHNWDTDWYSDGSNYGAAIAEALIVLLNRRGFNIEARAV